MTYFQYAPSILAAHPSLVGGILVVDVVNAPTPPALLNAYLAEQQAVITRIGTTPLSELSSLAAWRAAFRAFGVDPTGYRSAAEALLRRLTKKGDVPSINTLVDIGNLVSIRYGLPIAMVDVAALVLPITVHHAEGTETFVNLGQDEADNPAPGEVIFSDAAGTVVARRWCWRQSDASAARETTNALIVTCEAHHAGAMADVQAAMDDLRRLLAEYAGARINAAGVLSAERPAL